MKQFCVKCKISKHDTRLYLVNYKKVRYCVLCASKMACLVPANAVKGKAKTT